MDNNEQLAQRSEHSMEKLSYSRKGRYFKLRNILNIIFILLTLVGMGVFFMSSQVVGGGILIVCIFIKFTECVLRIIG